MRIACIADPAGRHLGLRVPPADMLVVAGNLTANGFTSEALDFAAWFAAQPHACKVVVPGGQDLAFKKDPVRMRDALRHAQGLLPEGVRFRDCLIWGLAHHHCEDDAFREGLEALWGRWARIPASLDILVTARPPRRTLDEVGGEPSGCSVAAEGVLRVKPRLHIFGGPGCRQGARFVDGRLSVNASVQVDPDPMVLNFA